MQTIYTAKRDEYGYLYAIILAPKSNKTTEFHGEGFETLQELRERMDRRHDGDAVFMSPSRFEAELASRQIHTPEIVALLEQYGELLGQDLHHHLVYGSLLRPTNTLFPGLEQAVHIPSDKMATGYHTYIATAEPIEEEK